MAKVNSHYNTKFFFVALFSTWLAFTVVILGAYTRLKDAGLGCPDWPGCYGNLIVPQTENAIKTAQNEFHQAVEPSKAWPEMIHRYFAGTLGLLILGLATVALYQKRYDKSQPLFIPLFLVGLLLFQAALGMWTVTWQLLPLVVMAHLLGGMTIAGLLWWLSLQSGRLISPMTHAPSLKYTKFVILGIVIVGLQIFLGGWTSANYASIICPEFPFCQGKLFPTLDIHQAFNFLSPIGKNYQGGVLGTSARVTIQMMHRYGAFITAVYVGILGLTTISFQNLKEARPLGWILLGTLSAQFLLGVLNIEMLLRLPIAVAHNGVALFLLLVLIALLYKLNSAKRILIHENFHSE